MLVADDEHRMPRQHPLTVADYRRMVEVGILRPDERLELIEGAIIEMTPIGPSHAYRVQKLAALFYGKLAGDYTLRVQCPIVLGDLSQPEPDLAIVHDRDYSTQHPGPRDIGLLIEVADTSAAYDRDHKARLYAAHEVVEYWLIDLAAASVERFRRPSADGYREVLRPAMDDRIFASAVPDLSTTPAELLGLPG